MSVSRAATSPDVTTVPAWILDDALSIPLAALRRAEAESGRPTILPPVDVPTTLQPRPTAGDLGPAPSPSDWRPVVARWSIARRERWGLLANELADAGWAWPHDEAEAFRRVKAEIEARR